MAQGLQVWDESGNLILDLSDRITKVIGNVTISDDGSLTNSQLSQGTFWYCPFHLKYTKANSAGPTFSVSGNTLTWTYPSGYNKLSFTMYYGVY